MISDTCLGRNEFDNWPGMAITEGGALFNAHSTAVVITNMLKDGCTIVFCLSNFPNALLTSKGVRQWEVSGEREGMLLILEQVCSNLPHSMRSAALVKRVRLSPGDYFPLQLIPTKKGGVQVLPIK